MWMMSPMSTVHGLAEHLPLSSNPPGAYVFGDAVERSKTLYSDP